MLRRIALGSCNDQGLSQDHWDVMRAAQPDLFLYGGDNVYADLGKDAEGRFMLLPADLGRLQAAYATLEASSQWQAFRGSVPMLATWDDHDYGENDAGAELSMRAGAEAAFLDFFEVPATDPRRAREGVYGAWAFGPPGRRVQIVMLDTRSFRSPLRPSSTPGVPPREQWEPDPDPSRTMLGEAQWAWLEQVLAEPADLRLVVSSIQVLSDGHGFERWGNFPHERARLLALLQGVPGAVLLSGDRHLSGLYRVDGAPPLWELTSSSLNKSFGGRDEADPFRIGDPFGPENFGIVEIAWDEQLVRLQVRDMQGGIVRSADVPLAGLTP